MHHFAIAAPIAGHTPSPLLPPFPGTAAATAAGRRALQATPTPTTASSSVPPHLNLSFPQPVVLYQPDSCPTNAGCTIFTSASQLQLSDPDDSGLSSMRVSIVTGFVPGEDILVLPSPSYISPGLQSRWDGGTGSLSITGDASYLAYEAALMGVRYVNLRAGTNDTAGFRGIGIFGSDAGTAGQEVNLLAPTSSGGGGSSNASSAASASPSVAASSGSNGTSGGPIGFLYTPAPRGMTRLIVISGSTAGAVSKYTLPCAYGPASAAGSNRSSSSNSSVSGLGANSSSSSGNLPGVPTPPSPPPLPSSQTPQQTPLLIAPPPGYPTYVDPNLKLFDYAVADQSQAQVQFAYVVFEPSVPAGSTGAVNGSAAAAPSGGNSSNVVVNGLTLAVPGIDRLVMMPNPSNSSSSSGGDGGTSNGKASSAQPVPLPSASSNSTNGSSLSASSPVISGTGASTCPGGITIEPYAIGDAGYGLQLTGHASVSDYEGCLRRVAYTTVQAGSARANATSKAGNLSGIPAAAGAVPGRRGIRYNIFALNAKGPSTSLAFVDVVAHANGSCASDPSSNVTGQTGSNGTSAGPPKAAPGIAVMMTGVGSASAGVGGSSTATGTTSARVYSPANPAGAGTSGGGDIATGGVSGAAVSSSASPPSAGTASPAANNGPCSATMAIAPSMTITSGLPANGTVMWSLVAMPTGTPGSNSSGGRNATSLKPNATASGSSNGSQPASGTASPATTSTATNTSSSVPSVINTLPIAYALVYFAPGHQFSPGQDSLSIDPSSSAEAGGVCGNLTVTRITSIIAASNQLPAGNASTPPTNASNNSSNPGSNSTTGSSTPTLVMASPSSTIGLNISGVAPADTYEKCLRSVVYSNSLAFAPVPPATPVPATGSNVSKAGNIATGPAPTSKNGTSSTASSSNGSTAAASPKPATRRFRGLRSILSDTWPRVEDAGIKVKHRVLQSTSSSPSPAASPSFKPSSTADTKPGGQATMANTTSDPGAAAGGSNRTSSTNSTTATPAPGTAIAAGTRYIDIVIISAPVSIPSSAYNASNSSGWLLYHSGSKLNSSSGGTGAAGRSLQASSGAGATGNSSGGASLAPGATTIVYYNATANTTITVMPPNSTTTGDNCQAAITKGMSAGAAGLRFGADGAGSVLLTMLLSTLVAAAGVLLVQN